MTPFCAEARLNGSNRVIFETEIKANVEQKDENRIALQYRIHHGDFLERSHDQTCLPTVLD
jgi:hypothetical protein